jgi:hypothetical protein
MIFFLHFNLLKVLNKLLFKIINENPYKAKLKYNAKEASEKKKSEKVFSLLYSEASLLCCKACLAKSLLDNKQKHFIAFILESSMVFLIYDYERKSQ